MHPAPTFDTFAIGGLRAVLLRLVKLGQMAQRQGSRGLMSRSLPSWRRAASVASQISRISRSANVRVPQNLKISARGVAKQKQRNRHLLQSKQAELGRGKRENPKILGVLRLFPWLADRHRRHPVPKSPHPNTSPTPSPPDHLRSLSPKPPFKTLHPAHIDPKYNSQQRNTSLIPYTIHIHLSPPLLPSPR